LILFFPYRPTTLPFSFRPELGCCVVTLLFSPCCFPQGNVPSRSKTQLFFPPCGKFSSAGLFFFLAPKIPSPQGIGSLFYLPLSFLPSHIFSHLVKNKVFSPVGERVFPPLPPRQGKGPTSFLLAYLPPSNDLLFSPLLKRDSFSPFPGMAPLSRGNGLVLGEPRFFSPSTNRAPPSPTYSSIGFRAVGHLVFFSLFYSLLSLSFSSPSFFLLHFFFPQIIPTSTFLGFPPLLPFPSFSSIDLVKGSFFFMVDRIFWCHREPN